MSSLTTDVTPAVYVPFPQSSWPNALRSVSVVLRSRGSLGTAADALRREIIALDPGQAVYDVRSLDEIVDASLTSRKLTSALAGFFSVLAGILAAVGIYGVIGYMVEQRTHEIGVRLAVGARQADVIWLVVGRALALAITGIAVGCGAALASAGLLSGFLFGVSGTDPLTFVLMAILVGLVALLASSLPARRAAKTDPASVFRSI
jgi:ABC-type antimicrobial peptide transport system permease subunit